MTASTTSRLRRLTVGTGATVATLGLILGTAGAANAAVLSKAGSDEHLVAVSGACVSKVSDTYYTLSVSASDGVISVDGDAFDTAAEPAFPAQFAGIYYPNGGAPSKAGVYAILGRAASLPSQSGSTSADRRASDSVWVHDGTQNQVLPGSEASWTDFSAGTFSVDLDVDWADTDSNGEYELYSSQLGSYFAATGDDSVFQIYSTSGIGTTNADSEWVINIELVD